MIVEQGPRMQASLSGNQRNPGGAFNAFSSLIFSFDTIDLTLPWTSLRVKWESRDLVWMVVGLPRWLSGTESACQAGDGGLIPGLERSPGEGNGNPLQCSCLENPIEEPGGLLFMGLHRVGHDWSDLAAAAAGILAWKIPWTEEPGQLSRTQLSDWTTTTTWMVVTCCVVSRFSHVQLWPYGLLPARLLWRFSRHEYWSGLPCPPSSRGYSQPRIEPTSFMSPALAGVLYLLVDSLPLATWDALPVNSKGKKKEKTYGRVAVSSSGTGEEG